MIKSKPLIQKHSFEQQFAIFRNQEMNLMRINK